MTVLSAITFLAIKHFICDFPLQATPWMYQNKGTYGHPGGVAHAVVHGIGTYFALGLVWVAIFDVAIHYHIDWAKMNLNARYELKPDNSEWFWILLGFDQLLHMLTYIMFVWGLSL